MSVNTTNIIRFRDIPFEISENDIIFIESNYNVHINRFIQLYYEDISIDFKNKGYNFIIFPRLSEEIKNEILHNIFQERNNPFINSISLKSNFLLNYLIEEDNYVYDSSLIFCVCSPYLYYSDGSYEIWMQTISMKDFFDCYQTKNLTPFLNEIQLYKETEEDNKWADWNNILPDGLNIFDDVEDDLDDYPSEIEETKDKKIRTSDPTEKLIDEIKDKIRELNQLKKGNSMLRYCLRTYLRYGGVLSDLHIKKIDREIKILMIGFGIECNFPALEKAFYLMYLIHHEGINFQLLREGECKKEVIQLYRWIKQNNYDENDEKRINKILA